MALTLVTSARQAMLARLTGADEQDAGPLNGTKMILYTNEVTVDPDLELADLTVATFDGYATSAAISFDNPFLDANKTPVITGTACTFLMTGTTTTETVYGYALVAPPSFTSLVGAENFDEPVNLTVTGQGLEVTPQLKIESAEVGSGSLDS